MDLSGLKGRPFDARGHASRLGLGTGLFALAFVSVAYPPGASAQDIPREATFLCTPQQRIGARGLSHSGRWVEQNDYADDPFAVSISGPTLTFQSTGEEFPVSHHGPHLTADLTPHHLALPDDEATFRLSWYAEEQVGVFLLSRASGTMTGITFGGLMGRCELATSQLTES